MKKVLLAIGLLVSINYSHAQKTTLTPEKVSSSCEAPDSVIAKYKTDAQRIALSRVYRFNSPLKNNAAIPAQWTDTILRALIAVYNAPLPKTDTVDGQTINILEQHSRPYQAGDMNAYWLTGFSFLADTNEQWVKDMKQKVFPTAEPDVNSFLIKYQISSSWFSIYMNYGAINSDSNYNIPVLAKEWENIRGVYKTELSGGFDGSFLIVDSITKDYIRVIYSYGYGDCPAGCINRRNWLYKVYFNCDVEFVKSWEGHITMPPPPTDVPYHGMTCTVPTLSFSPNPFTDYIQVNDIWEKANYKLVDIAGRIVRQGTVNNQQIDNLQDLPHGFYTIILSSPAFGPAKVRAIK